MKDKKDAKRRTEDIRHFDSNNKGADEPATKQPSSSEKDLQNTKLSDKQSKKQRKARDRQRIDEIRAQNEENIQQAQAQKQSRSATLGVLSKKDKKAFIKSEKEEALKNKEHMRVQKQQQRQSYNALSASEKAAFRKEARHQKKLEKKAQHGYVAKQTVKYVLLAALAAALVYTGIVAYGMFVDNSYAFQNTGETMLTPPPETSETPEPSVASDTPEITPTPTLSPYDMLLSQADIEFMMKDRENILVLGIDESLERSNWGSFRTDTMILMSIDFKTNDVSMISLPRDSYVWIYGKNYRSRINTAFSAGGGKDGSGFEYAMNTVSLLFGGVPVNNYVCFDMNVVKEVVTAMGGLYYDVDIEFTMCGRPMEKGYQYMDGQAVLDYCRERHVDSDIGRTARQRAMLLAIFQEMKSTGQIKDIPAIYSAVMGNIYTDLSFEQICSLAAFAMNMGVENIHEYYLEGDYLNIDGTSLWGVNQYKKTRHGQSDFW